MHTGKRFLSWSRLAVIALAAVGGVSGAFAQLYPNKPIRLVVPFPPGGSGDSVARILGVALGERLGQPVIIDNKPGGNLFIATQEVARAPADGYTLLMGLDAIFTINPHTFSKLPYDPVKNFVPVSQVTTQSMWFVASPKLGVKTMPELIALAHKKPSWINYGSGALIGQLTAEVLKTLTGASMNYIPYKGSGPAAQDFLAGNVDLVVADVGPFMQYSKDPRVVFLGHTGTGRSTSLPQVPTMSEQGVKNFEINNWFGVMAPAGTPASTVNKLNLEIRRALAEPDVKARIASFGLEAKSSTSSELAARIKDDSARWSRVIKAANIKLD